MGKLTHDDPEMLAADDPEMLAANEAQFLAAFKEHDYPKPAVTLDLCIFGVQDATLRVLLIRRKGHPFQGRWALPGGFLDVEKGEDIEEGARRELREETRVSDVYLEQLYTFGNATRDPRGYTVTVAWLGLLPIQRMFIQAGDDADDAQWLPVQDMLPHLAFDHATILSVALQRLRGKIDYAPIAFELVPPTFTIPDLREVYAAVKGSTYDPANFRRRFKRMLEDGVIEQAEGTRFTAGRPAKVFRFRRPT